MVQHLNPDVVIISIFALIFIPFFTWMAWGFCIIGPSEEERIATYEKEFMRQKIYARIEQVKLDSPEYWNLIEMLETAPSFCRLKPEQLKFLCPLPTRKGPNSASAIEETTFEVFHY